MQASRQAELRAQDVRLQKELEAQKLAMYQQLNMAGRDASGGRQGLYDELNAELAGDGCCLWTRLA